MTKREIKSAAMRLDPLAREALAEELLLSIGQSDRESIDAAWLAEVARRDKAFRAGKSKAAPAEQVLARFRRRKAV